MNSCHTFFFLGHSFEKCIKNLINESGIFWEWCFRFFFSLSLFAKCMKGRQLEIRWGEKKLIKSFNQKSVFACKGKILEWRKKTSKTYLWHRDWSDANNNNIDYHFSIEKIDINNNNSTFNVIFLFCAEKFNDDLLRI